MTSSSSQRRALPLSKAFPFGNKLIRSGYINREQQASLESRKSGRPLTAVLEALTGKSLPPDLVRQYKRQQLFELKILHGVESLDPEIQQIPTQQISQLINTLVPIDVCRRYQLVPLVRNGSPTGQTQAGDPTVGAAAPSVLVAMVNPEDLAALDDLETILRPQGLSYVGS